MVKKLLYWLPGLVFALLTFSAPTALAFDVSVKHVHVLDVAKFVQDARAAQAVAEGRVHLAAEAYAKAGKFVSRAPLDARKDLAAAAANRMIMLVQTANRVPIPERRRT